MITNEEARKAIEKYQKEHPVPFPCNTVDVTAISSKEGADIISQTLERISKQIDEDTELWCICEMAKMYMQGVRPVYPVDRQREKAAWQVDGTFYAGGKESSVTFKCTRCGRTITWVSFEGCKSKEEFLATFPYCHCGADMRKEADNDK